MHPAAVAKQCKTILTTCTYSPHTECATTVAPQASVNSSNFCSATPKALIDKDLLKLPSDITFKVLEHMLTPFHYLILLSISPKLGSSPACSLFWLILRFLAYEEERQFFARQPATKLGCSAKSFITDDRLCHVYGVSETAHDQLISSYMPL